MANILVEVATIQLAAPFVSKWLSTIFLTSPEKTLIFRSDKFTWCIQLECIDVQAESYSSCEEILKVVTEAGLVLFRKVLECSILYFDEYWDLIGA